MEVIGRISKVFDVRDGISQRTGEKWVSQDFLLEYFWWSNQTTPSKIMLSIFGADRIQEADLKEGEDVKVRLHPEAREYNGRWFNDVRFDGIEHIHREKAQNKPQEEEKPSEQAEQPTKEEKPAAGEKTDDLPF